MNEIWLKRALTAAQRGKGSCAPNPAVGAVLVKNERLLSEGFHEKAGGPHAEVKAIQNANESVEGATLYISLEPCCHFGKTPPCTDLIIQKKIARVIYAHHDPNPMVDGKGHEKLYAAGIPCERVEIADIEAFYSSYDRWTKHKLPFVTAKLAITLDGKAAGAQSERIAITGDIANRWVHERRRESDAILTTWKTVLHDNPKLNARIEDKIYAKPVYVLDSRLQTPKDANITRTSNRLHFFASEKFASPASVDHWRSKGAEVTLFSGEQIEWSDVWKKIGADGIHDLWIEAGGSTIEPLIKTKQLQRALLFVAPFWLGEKGLSAFKSANENLLQDAKHFEWQSKGRDVLLEILW